MSALHAVGGDLTPILGGEISYETIEPVLFCQDMDKIEDLERQLIDGGHNKVEQLNATCMEYEVIDGMVRRTLLIPKGTFVTGRIHKRPYIDMIIWGDVAVQVPDGVERYTQHTVLQGLAGRKRVLYTFEDTLWVTVDRTNVTDPTKVEDDVTVATFAEYNALMMGAGGDLCRG